MNENEGPIKPFSRATNKKCHFCPYKNCSATFEKNSKLVYHIRGHTGERPFACDVPNCDKSYFHSFHLRRHKESHDESPKERIKCPIQNCHLELSNKYNLKRHIKRKHVSDVYPFNCDFCKQGFYKKRQLVNHVHIHTGIPSLQCVICDNYFFTTTDLNRHKRTHNRYDCKCGTTFERWTLFLGHKKICDTAEKLCQICNKSFKCRNNFQAHLKTHFNGDAKTFICGYEACGRSYMYKKNLAHHIRSFHQKTPTTFVCTIAECAKAFTNKRSLQNHFRKHRGGTNALRKERKPRKDKGVSKKSTAAMLAGLELPPALHSHIIKGGTIGLETNELSDENWKLCNTFFM